MKYRIGFSIALFGIAFLLGYSSKKITTPHEEVPSATSAEEAMPEDSGEEISPTGAPAKIANSTPNADKLVVKNPECLKDPAVKQAVLEAASTEELSDIISGRDKNFWETKIKSRFSVGYEDKDSEQADYKFTDGLRRQSPSWQTQVTIPLKDDQLKISMLLTFYDFRDEVTTGPKEYCFTVMGYFETSKFKKTSSLGSCRYDTRSNLKFLPLRIYGSFLSKYISDIHITPPTETPTMDYILSNVGDWQTIDGFTWTPISREDHKKTSESWVETP